jgi:hypothetical protein
MPERQQSVASRPRRPSARRNSPAPKRPARGTVRWGRWALLGVVAFAASFGYFAVASSASFALRRVEIAGAHRLSTERLEELVRRTAAPRLLDVDLDEVREAVAGERYVRSVSVVRVLPDTLRVEIEERVPAVVIRLKSGRLGWVDDEGRQLDDYVPGAGGDMPPPLAGFEEERSERAAEENRGRIARYKEVRQALEGDALWDRLDEIDVRYLNDVKIQLADKPVVVRVGDRDFRGRLATALGLLAAVQRGDADTLARYHVPDVSRLLASAEAIDFIDMTRSNGSVTLGYSSTRSAPRSAPPAPAEFKTGTVVKSVPAAPPREAARKPAREDKATTAAKARRAGREKGRAGRNN